MAYTTIDKPDLYFNTVLYTGDGATYPSTQAITGVGFQPDLIWLKSRNNAYPHFVYDAVRTNRYAIFTNDTQAENSGTVNQMTSFDSDGFKVANDAGGVGTNGSGSTMTSWNWLGANGTASNNDGSITSTVSANTTSGFSIVTYTGTGSLATVGHGLGAVPKMILFKKTSGAQGWGVYHASVGNTGALRLDGTDATDTTLNYFNNTSPTSSVFTVNINNSVNNSGGTMIAYCFAEKKGFSKAFSYTGNGSSDGSYCHLGFKPSFILGKNSDNAFENWFIFDNKRDTYNTSYHQLFPNSSTTEGTNSAQNIDILSNGFKCRSAETRFNASGNKIIGIAFAENPFVTSTGIPTCAR